jgi:hypothetical protein
MIDGEKTDEVDYYYRNGNLIKKTYVKTFRKEDYLYSLWELN